MFYSYLFVLENNNKILMEKYSITFHAWFGIVDVHLMVMVPNVVHLQPSPIYFWS